MSDDWARRRATHFCAQFDELKGCEGIVADELRLARGWALDEAAKLAETWADKIWCDGEDAVLSDLARHIRALKEKQP